MAHDLIGVELEWQGCSGLIVETEAYAVEGDAACHTASRASTREFVKKQPPGTAYVYLNYGMYWLFNLLVKGGGHDSGKVVSARALAWIIAGHEIHHLRVLRERYLGA